MSYLGVITGESDVLDPQESLGKLVQDFMQGTVRPTMKRKT